MMLVLVSLATATILASAYLASRDNSAAIGRNISDATEARAAAMSAIEFAAAVLQTDADWIGATSDGTLVTGTVIGNAVVDIDVVDADTGGVTDSSTSTVDITTTATVGGISQVSRALMSVEPQDAGTRVDLDFSEFAIMTTEVAALADTSTLAVWDDALNGDAATTKPINVTSVASGSQTFSIGTNAAAAFTTIYVPPGSAASYVDDDSGSPATIVELSDDLPIAASPSFPGAPPSSTKEPDFDASSDTILATGGRFENFNADANVTVQVPDGQTIIVERDLDLASGASIVISGNVEIAVHGDVDMNTHSAILVEPDGKLKLWIGGKLTTSESYFGPSTFSGADDMLTGGDAPWSDPRAIQIYSIGTDPLETIPGAIWKLFHGTVATASFHAPNAHKFQIKHGSAIYGRVLTSDLSLTQGSSIFYDPSLDTGLGFTNPDSAIWTETGDIEPVIETSLTSLDDAVVDGIETSLGLTTVLPVAFVPSPVGIATARVNSVSWSMSESGADIAEWESDAQTVHYGTTQ